MIKVRKISKEEFYLNPSLIEIIEKTPDTMITLINKKKYIVSDTIGELLEKITEYYKVVGLTSPQITFHSYDFEEGDDTPFRLIEP